MYRYSEEELAQVLHIVTSSIERCKKYNRNLKKGHSVQTSKNRIKASYISKSLITEENTVPIYKRRINRSTLAGFSIRSKCE